MGEPENDHPTDPSMFEKPILREPRIVRVYTDRNSTYFGNPVVQLLQLVGRQRVCAVLGMDASVV